MYFVLINTHSIQQYRKNKIKRILQLLIVLMINVCIHSYLIYSYCNFAIRKNMLNFHNAPDAQRACALSRMLFKNSLES